MITKHLPNNYLSNLSLYIKLHRFIHHDKTWHEHKTKNNYTIWNIYEGNIWIEINQQIYKVSAGDVPGDTYKAYTDESGCSFLIQLSCTTKSPQNTLRAQEVRAGFEPAMTVLQTGALPLGYRTILHYMH